MTNVMLIILAKYWSLKGASHQPAFMSCCLTISHTCLTCLPSERKLLFWRGLFVVRREVSWGRWERCMSGVRWQGDKGGRIVQWHGRRSGKVVRWQFGKGGRVVSREGGTEFNDKPVLYCSREAKCKHGFTAGNCK